MKNNNEDNLKQDIIEAIKIIFEIIKDLDS